MGSICWWGKVALSLATISAHSCLVIGVTSRPCAHLVVGRSSLGGASPHDVGGAVAPEVAELLDLFVAAEDHGGVAVVAAFRPWVAGPATGGVDHVLERGCLEAGSDLV